jgi:hypothetical protein
MSYKIVTLYFSNAPETVKVLYCYLSISYIEINEEIRIFWLFFSIFHQKSRYNQLILNINNTFTVSPALERY